MMDYRYIELLLKRYFDCDTTPQEEDILRAFFSQDSIPAGLEKYAGLFKAEKELAEATLSEGFEDRIMSRVEGTEVHARRISFVRRIIPLYKAAAGVAIVLCLALAAEQGITTGDSTVTPRAAKPAGEQVSVLPEPQPAIMQDTLLVTQ